RLFLARDRFGEKPLYYSIQRNLFAFASELHALTHHNAFDPMLDKRSLQKFFAYGFLPAPNALYRHTYKLPAACYLSFEIGGNQPHVQSYWRYRVEPDESLRPCHENDLVDELRGLLAQAVRRRLMSDVPLGIFLSGGLDSSAILAMASAQCHNRAISSFSIGFREPSFDEAAWSRRVARVMGSCHHEEVLSVEAM